MTNEGEDIANRTEKAKTREQKDEDWEFIVKMMIIMKAVSDIVKIVEDYLNVSLHEDTIAYSRFVIHLKFLFKTVLSKQNVPEVAGMDFIFTQIKSEYKNVIECVKKIADYIMEKFNYRCTDGDCIYLMLHVVRLYETTLN